MGEPRVFSYVMSLEEAKRSKLRYALEECLPIMENGSIPLVARAWAAGKV